MAETSDRELTRLVGARDPELAAAIADLCDYWASAAALGCATAGTGAVKRLEAQLGDLLGNGRRVLAVSSGTAALVVGLRALGIGPGDEVITSGYDWGASTAAIRCIGAQPMHADVELTTGLIDPQSIAALLTHRTTAIVVTHLFGRSVSADVIGMCHEKGLALIEDCAQALGGTWNGRPVGAWGDLAAFSFGPNKAVTGLEGGAVATSSRYLWARMVRSSQHPNRQVLEGIKEPDHFCVGERIHPLSAALVSVRLPRLLESLERRLRTAQAIMDRLHHEAVPHLCLPEGSATWSAPNFVLLEHGARKLHKAGLVGIRGPLGRAIRPELCVAAARARAAYTLGLRPR